MNTQSLEKEPINCKSILKFGSKATKNSRLSVLLIGQSDFCHLMSECIYSIKPQYHKMELTISESESIESISESSLSLHVDFIVFLMNTAQRYCIEQVERNICLVEPVYLCDKMILVNGSNHLSPAEMGLSYDELSNLTQKYRLHIIHGNIKNEESCLMLAKRILNLGGIICGLTTGMPMTLEFPTNKFPLY